MSAASVLRPAGVGGRLAFVAVQESGHNDQNGPQEEHAVDDSDTVSSNNCGKKEKNLNNMRREKESETESERKRVFPLPIGVEVL